MSHDVDIQLQVWKDLAISKQILMGAATDALGLDAECSTDELKAALNQAIQRAREADNNILETRTRTEQQIAEYCQQVETAEQARSEAEEKVANAQQAREQAERQLANGKAENAEALKKARAEVVDKQNKLKAISKALADTPENVVRKLKTLKKQKMDEAKLRGQAETKLQAARKDKTRLEGELEAQRQSLESAVEMLGQLKSMHEICVLAEATIQKLSDDKKDQITAPKLDLEAIEALEQALAQK